MSEFVKLSFFVFWNGHWLLLIGRYACVGNEIFESPGGNVSELVGRAVVLPDLRKLGKGVARTLAGPGGLLFALPPLLLLNGLLDFWEHVLIFGI